MAHSWGSHHAGGDPRTTLPGVEAKGSRLSASSARSSPSPSAARGRTRNSLFLSGKKPVGSRVLPTTTRRLETPGRSGVFRTRPRPRCAPSRGSPARTRRSRERSRVRLGSRTRRLRRRRAFSRSLRRTPRRTPRRPTPPPTRGSPRTPSPRSPRWRARSPSPRNTLRSILRVGALRLRATIGGTNARRGRARGNERSNPRRRR